MTLRAAASAPGVPIQAEVLGNPTIGSVLSFKAPTGVAWTAIQWYRNGAAISGATNTTYTYTAPDVGTSITVELTGLSQMSAPLGTKPAGSGAGTGGAQFSDATGSGLSGPGGYVPLVGIPSTGTSSITYDTSGRISTSTQIVSGATIIRTYSYDTLGRLSTLLYNNGTTVKTTTYTYDTSGRVSSTAVT